MADSSTGKETIIGAEIAPEGLALGAEDLAGRIARKAGCTPAEAAAAAAAVMPAHEAKSSLRARAGWFLRRGLRKAYGWPVVGYCARLCIGVARLPRYLDQLQRVANETSDLAGRQEIFSSQVSGVGKTESRQKAFEVRVSASMDEIYAAIEQLQGTLASASERSEADLNELRAALPQIQEDVVHLKRASADVQRRALSAPVPAVVPPSLSAASSLAAASSTAELAGTGSLQEKGEAHASAVPEALDLVYMGIEERFRGEPETIRTRQSVYLEPLAQAMAAGHSQTLLDVGCGRGEFLRLALDQGYKAQGVDLNTVAVGEAQAAGLDVVRMDALEALRCRADSSLSAISVFHLIEHLPFPVLAQMVLEARRVLEPGGLLILETPNPGNLTVGAHTFWLDPTHRAPVPSKLSAYLCEVQGFAKAEVLELNPSPLAEEGHPDPVVDRLNQALYGPQDYAVLAWA